jgi:hypothetical protein
MGPGRRRRGAGGRRRRREEGGARRPEEEDGADGWAPSVGERERGGEAGGAGRVGRKQMWAALIKKRKRRGKVRWAAGGLGC